jgi:hypothetical protein
MMLLDNVPIAEYQFKTAMLFLTNIKSFENGILTT